MHGILTCVTDKHDATLLFAALIVCGVGIYAASAIAAHAARAEGVSRRNWALISIVAAGCTAWATHMIALLAFRPGMDAGFEPVLTALSLLLVIGGIGGGMALSVGQHGRVRRFLAGTTIGLGIAALHYVGQAAYLITGHVTWQLDFVIGSVLISLAMSGTAIVLAGERNRALRRYAMPLLLGSIVVLHLCGMTAVTLTYDPQVALLHTAIPPGTIAPIMVAVSLALLGLAVIGLRMTLAARAQLRRDRERLRELASLALEGLAICDGDVIITANQSLEQLTNMRQADLVGAAPLSDPAETRHRRSARARRARRRTGRKGRPDCARARPLARCPAGPHPPDGGSHPRPARKPAHGGADTDLGLLRRLDRPA